jgi:hypothetical protein
MNNVVFMMSYKKNINGTRKWNEMVKYTKPNFVKKGFKVFMVEGYNKKEHPDIKMNQLVYLNFIDKAIPKAEKFLDKNKNVDGIFIAEDDAWINPTYSELKKKIKLGRNEPLIRVGYQKKLKINDKRGHFVVGNQLIWIPRNSITKLKEIMLDTTPQHINGFFSKAISNLKIIIAEKGLVDECEHFSLIAKGIRKGRDCTKKTKKKL